MSENSRRKLLISIAAGSGAIVAGNSLPESWSRPVVDSVILPVHAQTSETISYFEMDTQRTEIASLIEENYGRQNMLAEVMDSLVPDAKAQGGDDLTDWCVMVTGGVANVKFVNNSGDAIFQGNIPTDGTSANLPLLIDLCANEKRAGGRELRIVDYTFGDSTITIRVTGDQPWEVTIPISITGCDELATTGSDAAC